MSPTHHRSLGAVPDAERRGQQFSMGSCLREDRGAAITLGYGLRKTAARAAPRQQRRKMMSAVWWPTFEIMMAQHYMDNLSDWDSLNEGDWPEIDAKAED
jgi:hypothetical protein